MDKEIKNAFSHVLWIGGATDSGKSTIAQMIAEKYSFQVYHYDRHDLKQIEQLAITSPHYQAVLTASLDERWVQPEPEELLRFVLRSFQDRFPLVLDDLLAMPRATKIVAEGFGFTPDLLAPLLVDKHQAVWLVASEAFKRASMARRNKPSFQAQTSDPERAAANVLRRDMLLAEYITAQVRAHDLTLFEVDGSQTVEVIAARIEAHFASFLPPTEAR